MFKLLLTLPLGLTPYDAGLAPAANTWLLRGFHPTYIPRRESQDDQQTNTVRCEAAPSTTLEFAIEGLTNVLMSGLLLVQNIGSSPQGSLLVCPRTLTRCA